MTLQLTASYGHDVCSGIWISLRADQFDAEFLTEALASYGCDPERFAPKVIALLRSSGRYDCVVQRTWIVNAKDRFIREMAALGVTVITDPNYKPVS